ncbi:ATP phosphoribosyltransferase [Sporosarcina pasteurii]|uniref:ATP phosphoribosyltransferase n=1 Tax=Sporosarcina pasteurii TaxID=1474 RepID=A0A380C781_SPOPA|nr:ATP phosphoribosyltransferase [Sporosarcina pasteurii]MDS9473032.1 ATP phosphoribosyltransferase [Sporosarcina pasteurii]QBQ04541.1 ATP phosphoribosyltransferase [Sporosarcina pasteurii]SUJ14193.1 ATP phosphoribosyltransferase [Sporosarcina pasteurii]
MSSLTLAIATGRTAKQAMALLEKAGITFPDFHNKSRKLVMLDETEAIKLILVKTADLPTYVEKGAADIGIIGKDIIMEEQPDIYELVDLQIGKCKVAVAGFPNQALQNGSPLTVATKYPFITKSYFDEKGIRVETIKLNGSIELAPLIGLSDVIVDIVETGTTLKENGLVVLDEIMDISARLIVNKASFATKTVEIEQVINQVKAALE